MQSRHILYTVLDWGLGHATRSVPVIRELLKYNTRITIAGKGHSLKLLQQEFPSLHTVQVKGLELNFNDHGSVLAQVIRNFNNYRNQVIEEKKEFEKIVSDINPDAIISDNCYGAYSEKIPSVIISHQLHLHLPGVLNMFGFIADYYHQKYLKKFSEIWIPDYSSDKNLSGKLSHPPLKNNICVYTGPLSRLSLNNNYSMEIPDILIILSGPEPFKSQLENICRKYFINSNYKLTILNGNPDKTGRNTKGNIRTIINPSVDELGFLIKNSKYIISRPGYSTIMDLGLFGRSAILIPTPGQTEQEYLADLHAQKGFHVKMDPDNADFENALKKVEQCKPSIFNKGDELQVAVKSLLDKL